MTLKMTSSQVVETSVVVNNNSSFQNYTNPDDHTQQTNNNFVTNAVLDVRNSNVLLKTRLREFNRIAVDVGGGGDCFFRAVSHQLYGNPNNHYLVRSLGIQYLMHNPEQFIESNTDCS